MMPIKLKELIIMISLNFSAIKQILNHHDHHNDRHRHNNDNNNNNDRHRHHYS